MLVKITEDKIFPKCIHLLKFDKIEEKKIKHSRNDQFRFQEIKARTNKARNNSHFSFHKPVERAVFF